MKSNLHIPIWAQHDLNEIMLDIPKEKYTIYIY